MRKIWFWWSKLAVWCCHDWSKTYLNYLNVSVTELFDVPYLFNVPSVNWQIKWKSPFYPENVFELKDVFIYEPSGSWKHFIMGCCNPKIQQITLVFKDKNVCRRGILSTAQYNVATNSIFFRFFRGKTVNTKENQLKNWSGQWSTLRKNQINEKLKQNAFHVRFAVVTPLLICTLPR